MHEWTPVGHPQSNGILENRYEVLDTQITVLQLERDSEIEMDQVDDILPLAVALVNRLPSARAPYQSPYERMTGVSFLPAYVEETMKGELWPRMKESNLNIAQAFYEGDLVLFRHLLQKFGNVEEEWKPYTIVSRLSPTRYQLKPRRACNRSYEGYKIDAHISAMRVMPGKIKERLESPDSTQAKKKEEGKECSRRKEKVELQDKRFIVWKSDEKKQLFLGEVLQEKKTKLLVHYYGSYGRRSLADRIYRPAVKRKGEQAVMFTLKKRKGLEPDVYEVEKDEIAIEKAQLQENGRLAQGTVEEILKDYVEEKEFALSTTIEEPAFNGNASFLASTFGANVVLIRVEEAEELLGSLMDRFKELKVCQCRTQEVECGDDQKAARRTNGRIRYAGCLSPLAPDLLPVSVSPLTPFSSDNSPFHPVFVPGSLLCAHRAFTIPRSVMRASGESLHVWMEEKPCLLALQASYEEKKARLQELERKVEEARQRPASGRVTTHALPNTRFPPRPQHLDNLRVHGGGSRAVQVQPQSLRQHPGGADGVPAPYPAGRPFQAPPSHGAARYPPPVVPFPPHANTDQVDMYPPSTSATTTAAAPGGGWTTSPPPDSNRRDVPVVATVTMPPAYRGTRTRPSSGLSQYQQTEEEQTFGGHPNAPVLDQRPITHVDPGTIPPPPAHAPSQIIRPPPVSPLPVHQRSLSSDAFVPAPAAYDLPQRSEPVSQPHTGGNTHLLPYSKQAEGGGNRAVLAQHESGALGAPSVPVSASPSSSPPQRTATSDHQQQPRNPSVAHQHSDNGWTEKQGFAVGPPPIALSMGGEGGTALGGWSGNTSAEVHPNAGAQRGAEDAGVQHNARGRAVLQQVHSQPTAPNAPSPPQGQVPPQGVTAPSLFVSDTDETLVVHLQSFRHCVAAGLTMLPQLTSSTGGAVSNPPSAPRVDSHSFGDKHKIEELLQPSHAHEGTGPAGGGERMPPPPSSKGPLSRPQSAQARGGKHEENERETGGTGKESI
uniref:Integrase catalytic domain-containing protein n=1 Tax=Chromera velia CCMP2878 TaxID=1169474 RepID=A0A0G4ICC7_9ALVE|eukprot:Cvel_13074.t1-p1 / transcript=Cvel_13074.t1 / gene=Cvel_13074 / organism=Chromera_velia_CCMP2878 / gene_product=hypothetical protein / transcript_product=hypothetical protein / location=Cvel_scaffold880:31426-42308(+) / protein_length=999 / sequence_SO=supercontig / SO=protein_coding / is_pseudo=false